MKYSVLIKPKVMVRIDGIEANSQKEAAVKALQQLESNSYDLFQKDLRNFNRHDYAGSFQHMEHADGEFDFEALVDEEGDEEFSRSGWYIVHDEDVENVIEDSPELRKAVNAVYERFRGGKKKHRVMILWGATPQDNETQPIEYAFETEEELEAFLHGVSEGDGWLEYEVLDDLSNRCPVCFAELEYDDDDNKCCSYDDSHGV